MQEVVAPAAVDDVVGVAGLKCESPAGSTLNGVRLTVFLSSPVTLIVACWTLPGVVISRFWLRKRACPVTPDSGSPVVAVAAGVDAAVVAQHAVAAGAARDPVVAVAADQVVVLAVAEQHVVADLAVDEVVARFAVDLVAGADVECRRWPGRSPGHPACSRAVSPPAGSASACRCSRGRREHWPCGRS